MEHWFTSDAHFFFHKNIIKYCNRPFIDVQSMNETLINNWNSVVSPGDVVYSLGDFAMGKIGEIKDVLSRLNGKLHMITGNHDQEIIKNANNLVCDGYVKEVVPYKEISINGQFICMFHYGCRVWNRSHRGSWLLYGHSHNNLPPFGKSVDVGVDSTSILGHAPYRPFSYKEIYEFMKTRDAHECI